MKLTAADIAARRKARGMADPLNQLSAHIDAHIATGGDPIVEIPAAHYAISGLGRRQKHLAEFLKRNNG